MNSERSRGVGFVGIGTMGAPMVRCLASAGLRPTLYDTNADASGNCAAELGLSVAHSLTDLGRRVETVILMLPNSDIVRRVCLGEGALAETLSPDAMIIDMSSSDPIETRSLGSDLAERRITLLDAPVSGGVRKAAAGTLAIMLGGDDPQAVGRATPLLEAMGMIYRTGGLGSGHAAKALNNYVSAAGLVAACEAVIVGRAFGLDAETLVQVLNASTGRNNSTENKLSQFVLSDEYRRAGFALDLMAKDVALAASLAERLGVRLPDFSAARALWGAAQDDLEKGADHTEIFRYLQTLAGAA